jgi:thymidylate kinase
VFTVALIGPDGAGKTTIARRLLEGLPLPTKYLYMGVNNDASNHVLPTTSIIRAMKRAWGAQPDIAGPPEVRRPDTKPRGLVKRTLRGTKSMLSLMHRVSEEWYRQILTWQYQWRGYVVLYDRHYFVDYFAYDIAHCDWDRPLAKRIHGYMLDRIYPKPQLVIYLDAPSEVLFARKGEGTIEALERRRRDYLQIKEHVPHFVIVDANRSLDQVTQDVTQTVVNFHRSLQEKKQNKSAPTRSAKLHSVAISRLEQKS